MEENHIEEKRKSEYEARHLSTKIETIGDSLNQLKQDVYKIMYLIENMPLAELIEKTNYVIDNHNSGFIEEKNEIDLLKEEILHLKEQINQSYSNHNTTEQPQSPKVSEYKRLQNMLHSSTVAAHGHDNISNNFMNGNNTMNRINFNKNNQSKVPQRNLQNKSLKAKESHQNNQFGLNKNIITRTSTAKKKS